MSDFNRVASNSQFVAYISKAYGGCAMVTIHPRPAGDRYGVDFSRTVAEYETLSNGATASARREIAKLAREARA